MVDWVNKPLSYTPNDGSPDAGPLHGCQAATWASYNPSVGEAETSWGRKPIEIHGL